MTAELIIVLNMEILKEWLDSCRIDEVSKTFSAFDNGDWILWIGSKNARIKQVILKIRKLLEGRACVSALNTLGVEIL